MPSKHYRTRRRIDKRSYNTCGSSVDKYTTDPGGMNGVPFVNCMFRNISVADSFTCFTWKSPLRMCNA